MIPRQLHKCETGTSRISIGRLHRIARALGVEVGYFFADVDPAGCLAGAEPDEAGRDQGRRLQELVRHAAGIGDPGHRAALCRLARDLASLEVETPDDPQVEQRPASIEGQSGASRLSRPH
jgi:hypothetical protein